ncbi:SPOR domain-containing protein [Gemmatimonadota bacterium]
MYLIIAQIYQNRGVRSMSAARLLKSSSIALLLVSVAAGTACSRYRSTSRPVKIDEQEKNERVFETNEQAVKAGIYEDFADSAALKRDEVIPRQDAPAEPLPVPSVPAAGTISDPPVSQPSQNVILGFRVQLGAFNDMESAQALAEKARTAFGTYCPVYVRFYSPYWKVQAGDCAIRDEAQSLQNFLRRNGYPDTFIVKAGIQR